MESGRYDRDGNRSSPPSADVAVFAITGACILEAMLFARRRLPVTAQRTIRLLRGLTAEQFGRTHTRRLNRRTIADKNRPYAIVPQGTPGYVLAAPAGVPAPRRAPCAELSTRDPVGVDLRPSTCGGWSPIGSQASEGRGRWPARRPIQAGTCGNSFAAGWSRSLAPAAAETSSKPRSRRALRYVTTPWFLEIPRPLRRWTIFPKRGAAARSFEHLSRTAWRAGGSIIVTTRSLLHLGCPPQFPISAMPSESSRLSSMGRWNTVLDPRRPIWFLVHASGSHALFLLMAMFAGRSFADEACCLNAVRIPGPAEATPVNARNRRKVARKVARNASPSSDVSARSPTRTLFAETLAGWLSFGSTRAADPDFRLRADGRSTGLPRPNEDGTDCAHQPPA